MNKDIWFGVYDDFSDIAGKPFHHLIARFLEEEKAVEYLDFLREKYSWKRFVLFKWADDKPEKIN